MYHLDTIDLSLSKAPRFLAIAVCFLLTSTNQVSSESLKLAIFAPTTGPNQSIGLQVKVGVKIAKSRFKEENLKVFYTNWDEENIQRGLSNLENLAPDIVIASVGKSNFVEFYQALEKSERSNRLVPTTFLVRNHSSENRNMLKKFRTIINIGYTYEDFHRLSLSTWAKGFGLKNPMVVYKQAGSYDNLKSASLHALQKSGAATQRMVKLSNILKNNSKTDGIVLVGQPGEMVAAARTINRKLGKVPVFVSGNFVGPSLEYMKSQKLSAVSYATMWESGIDPERNKLLWAFADEANNSLGWQPYAFSSFAVDAYNATLVAISAWNAWKKSDQKSNRKGFWDVLVNGSLVSGLAGEKIVYWPETKSMVSAGLVIGPSKNTNFKIEMK